MREKNLTTKGTKKHEGKTFFAFYFVTLRVLRSEIFQFFNQTFQKGLSPHDHNPRPSHLSRQKRLPTQIRSFKMTTKPERDIEKVYTIKEIVE